MISIKQENDYEIEYKNDLISNVISDETGNVSVINIITSDGRQQQIQLDPQLLGQQIILQQQIHGQNDGNNIVYITSPMLSQHHQTSQLGNNDNPPPLQLIQATTTPGHKQQVQHIHIEHAEHTPMATMATAQTSSTLIQNPTQNYNIACKLCPKKFTNLEHFRTHMGEHLIKNNIKIEMVTVQQDSPPPLQLIQHFPSHGQQLQSIAQHEVYEIEVLNEEIEIEQPQEPVDKSNIDVNIVCKVCKKTFFGANNFAVHMETSHTNDSDVVRLTKIEMVDLAETQNQEKSSYPCAFCPKKYLWHKFLVTHSKVHKTPGPFVCSICGEPCHGLYFDHMKTHVLVESRDCSRCDESFASLKLLKEHMIGMHDTDLDPDDSKHKCGVCGKRYKALSYLREHERIHTGEKPYTCDVCGKGFAKYGCFAEHKKTHQVQRAFKCPMCIKAFTKRRYLKAHLLRHPKTADFDKYFVDDVNGETPLRKFLFAPNKREPKVKKPAAKLDCAICFKEFKKLRYLKAHIARHPDKFVRQKLGILPGAPIPALISSGSFNQNRLTQTNKNSLINFDNTPTMAKKPLSSDESSSDEESSSEEQSDTETVVDNTLKEKGEMSLPIIDGSDEIVVEELSSSSNQQVFDFYCSICQKHFDQLSHLVDHEQVHVGETPLKCKMCRATFVLPSKYAEHIQTHQNHTDADVALLLDEDEQKFELSNRYSSPEEKSFTCCTCGDTFFNEKILEEHEEIHGGEEPFKCSMCEKTFAVSSNYVEHQKTHVVVESPKIITRKRALDMKTTPPKSTRASKKAVVEVIMKTAKDDEEKEECQDDHLDGGSDEEAIKLTPIKEEAVVEVSLSTRPRRAAAGRNKWKEGADQIGLATPRKRTPKTPKSIAKVVKVEDDQGAEQEKAEDDIKEEQLESSPETMITTNGKKRFNCKICNKQYTTAFYLREHLQIHSGERPHKCKICGKTFAVISCYREHVELHTNKKSHKCKECGVSFAVARYLKAHMRRHAVKESPDADNKFFCDQCGKNYRSNTALKDHMRLHNGEAPFKCSVCDKEFQLMASLREHMRKHEKSEFHACPFCPKTFALARYLQQHLVRHIQKIDSETNGGDVNDTSLTMTTSADAIKSEDEEETDTYVPSADGQTLVRVADARKKRSQKYNKKSIFLVNSN